MDEDRFGDGPRPVKTGFGAPLPRWVWAVVAATGVLVLWLAAPGAIRGTFSSPGSFLRVAAVVVALVAFGRIVTRLVPNPIVATVLRIAPVLAVGWWALVPYFSPSEVDEAFPVVTESPSTATSPPDDLDTVAAPVLLRSGTFQGLTGHRGRGTASLYDLPDGSRLLRFENLDAGPGPDLDVYVVPRADARSLTDAVRVDDLTAERGNQNYAVPAEVDLTSGEWTVLIWCQSFAVEVANATLI